MILKYNNFLNEKVIHPDFDVDFSEESYKIISYKKYIFFMIQNDSWENISAIEDDENLKPILELLDIPNLDTDYTLEEYISEERPDIIVLTWEKESINLNIFMNLEFNQDPKISKHFIDTLKVLRKKLNVKWLNISEYMFGENGEEYPQDENIFIDNIIDNFNKDIKVRKIPKTVYHGTTSNYLQRILKIGLRPNEKSNFNNINHDDRIFYTSSKADAQFYTNKSTNNVGGIPIILEISTKNMDTSKIDLDYDFYVDYIKQGHEKYDEIYYASKHSSVNKLEDKTSENLKKLKDKYIGATYRKFSYVGNMFPKEIIKIWYSESWDNEIFDEYFDEPLKDTYSMLEFFDYIKQMYGDEYYADYMAYQEYLEEEEENAKKDYDLEL